MSSSNDPFRCHFDHLLNDFDTAHLSSSTNTTKSLKYSTLGDILFSIPFSDTRNLDPVITKFSPNQFRPNLRRIFESRRHISQFQEDLLSILIDYKDLLFSDFSTSTSRERNEEITFVYAMHVLNHVLKSRHRILKNNTKLRNQTTKDDDEVDSDQFLDQGLTRPKVLILLPFRYMALNFVRTIIDLLSMDEKCVAVMNKKRFFKEYDVEDEEKESKEKDNFEELPPGKRPRLERPLDYKETFRGNIDDCFRLGISVGKGGNLKLFTEFYSSDIILASPLGLRMAMGAEGEKEYDYDFLSSIELLILDRADVFLMQNWSHVLHILQHLHKQPRESHGTDFSRVRLWNLNGWSKYYRQTLVFSSVLTPEMKAIFNTYSRNFDGRVFAIHDKKSGDMGSLSRVIVSLPHAFQRFSCDDILLEADNRFEYFIQTILPQYTDSSMNGTLIYVQSYYDFVRLRNYFKKNDNSVSCVQICEYTNEKKVSRARDLFFHGEKHFLLYTERFHFYHRYRIRGIKNLIFYQLPTYAHFYSEICNAMLDEKTSRKKTEEKAGTFTCSVLFSKFDALRLAGVLGQDKAMEVLNSNKNVHVFITE